MYKDFYYPFNLLYNDYITIWKQAMIVVKLFITINAYSYSWINEVKLFGSYKEEHRWRKMSLISKEISMETSIIYSNHNITINNFLNIAM